MAKFIAGAAAELTRTHAGQVAAIACGFTDHVVANSDIRPEVVEHLVRGKESSDRMREIAIRSGHRRDIAAALSTDKRSAVLEELPRYNPNDVDVAEWAAGRGTKGLARTLLDCVRLHPVAVTDTWIARVPGTVPLVAAARPGSCVADSVVTDRMRDEALWSSRSMTRPAATLLRARPGLVEVAASLEPFLVAACGSSALSGKVQLQRDLLERVAGMPPGDVKDYASWALLYNPVVDVAVVRAADEKKVGGEFTAAATRRLASQGRTCPDPGVASDPEDIAWLRLT